MHLTSRVWQRIHIRVDFSADVASTPLHFIHRNPALDRLQSRHIPAALSSCAYNVRLQIRQLRIWFCIIKDERKRLPP